MKLNKRIAFFLLILLLGLAACSGEETDSSSDLAGAALSTQPAETVAEATEPAAAEPTQEPAANTPTLEPTPTEAQAIAETEPETAESEPTEAEAAPAEAQVNGRYENTFYRGLETAPVTMIDYSDFL